MSLEDYEEIRVLGKGAFGKALLVKRKSNDVQYVMKVISMSTMKPSERAEAQQEAEVLKQFNHPNIVRYIDCFTENRNLLIVMEYANGGDLSQLIEQQKALKKGFSEDEVLFYFVQLLLAMKHVHDRKILHRDLKGANIFLQKINTTDGKVRNMVKLGDFGVSKILSSTLDSAKTAVGTPYYLSPEICQSRGYNNKSDVWSLGCILYELCTLEHVFDAQNLKMLVMRILDGKYSPISSSLYSDNLRQLVDSMLAKNPDDRPTVAKIFELPFIQKWIPRLLPPELRHKEFPHLFKAPHALSSPRSVNLGSPSVSAVRNHLASPSFQLQRQLPTSPSVEQVHSHAALPSSPLQQPGKDEVFGDNVSVAANQAVHQYSQQMESMKPTDSLMFRIEKTRVFLEKQLGFDKFFSVYQAIQSSYIGTGEQVDFDNITKLLGDEQGCVNMIVQLILMENQLNQQ